MYSNHSTTIYPIVARGLYTDRMEQKVSVVAFTVRFPMPLYRALKERARLARRSVQSQVLHEIEEAERPDRGQS